MSKNLERYYKITKISNLQKLRLIDRLACRPNFENKRLLKITASSWRINISILVFDLVYVFPMFLPIITRKTNQLFSSELYITNKERTNEKDYKF